MRCLNSRLERVTGYEVVWRVWVHASLQGSLSGPHCSSHSPSPFPFRDHLPRPHSRQVVISTIGLLFIGKVLEPISLFRIPCTALGLTILLLGDKWISTTNLFG
ncbi:hypothetical protein CR513_48050, partial [Mucuna pruriens]